jgi:hypothetical protein
VVGYAAAMTRWFLLDRGIMQVVMFRSGTLGCFLLCGRNSQPYRAMPLNTSRDRHLAVSGSGAWNSCSRFSIRGQHSITPLNGSLPSLPVENLVLKPSSSLWLGVCMSTLAHLVSRHIYKKIVKIMVVVPSLRSEFH